MEDRDLIINQIRQRLEILYQIVEDLQNGDDPGENYYTKAQINALLLGKVDVVAGKGLSTNDYTNADKAAVASIADISYNLGVLESVVDGLFDPLDETVAQGGEVSSAQKADIREQKPISLNGNVYYFVEDNGTSYIYCSYDDTNSQLLIAAIGKSNWLVNFTSESLGGAVTGVKGNAESTYRTGNVNITKANIGLGNVDNTSDMNKPLSTAAKTYIDDAINVINDTDDMQDRALAELYAADVNIGLRIDGLEDDIDAKTTVAAIYGLPPTTIAPAEGTTESLNSYTTPGAYTVPTSTAAGRITESPVTTRGYRLEVKQYRSGTYYRQTIMPWGEPEAIYTRSRQGGTNWTAWYKFEGTQVQTVQSLNSPLMLNREETTQLETNEIEERGEINGTSTDWQNE